MVRLLEEKWPEEEVWLVMKETKVYEEAVGLLVQEELVVYPHPSVNCWSSERAALRCLYR